MDCKATRIPYSQTGAFTRIVIDYLGRHDALREFIAHPPEPEGIMQAIREREKFPTQRKLLVEELKKQYKALDTTSNVMDNIHSLLSPDTFTVTTAHQNNIFTGPLYFIYKILHAIKLAAHLNGTIPGKKFVPVFYMGSEDADLQELNHIFLEGQKLVWNTSQTGAVGRMKIDKELISLVEAMEGRLAVMPHGAEAVSMLKESYRLGESIEMGTFRAVNSLFAKFGLVVLLPDSAALKSGMIRPFEDDLVRQVPSEIVQKTSSRLGAHYKVQAHPRDINLFYLLGDRRERIELKDNRFQVLNTDISFSTEEIISILKSNPERFSPNVILRGLYQGTILPDVAFIGGGGELAYWLELKDLFNYYQVPYPVLVLRNSFLVIERKWQEKIDKLGFGADEIFLSENELLNRIVTKRTLNDLQLNGTITETEQLYENVKNQAAKVDLTLEKHVEALKATTLYRLRKLEKKMLRAEKRKFTDQHRTIEAFRQRLFPGNGLQERYENLFYFFAKWGIPFISELYTHSLALEQEFTVLSFRE